MIKCSICGISTDSFDDAVEEGWIPFFFEGDGEHGPACSSCSEKLICRGQDGNFELKEEYEGRIIYAEQMDVETLQEEVVLGYILN